MNRSDIGYDLIANLERKKLIITRLHDPGSSHSVPRLEITHMRKRGGVGHEMIECDVSSESIAINSPAHALPLLQLHKAYNGPVSNRREIVTSILEGLDNDIGFAATKRWNDPEEGFEAIVAERVAQAKAKAAEGRKVLEATLVWGTAS